MAQDVVHDAFLALWRAPEAFDATRGAFRTFFLALVHHRAVDTIRREERLRARHDRAANLQPVEDGDPRRMHTALASLRRVGGLCSVPNATQAPPRCDAAGMTWRAATQP